MKITDTFKKTETLSADEARKWLADKKEGEFTLIDVREPEEYEKGHLAGALLMPLSGLLGRLKELDSSKTAIIYCRTGNRSMSAAALMMGQGFNKVYSIEGGINAWNGLAATGRYESGMFLLEGRKTTEELISLAWALEGGARLFYEKIREFVRDNEAKQIFESLVKAEEKHKMILLKTYRQIKGVDITGELLVKGSLTGFMEGGISIEDALLWLKAQDRTLQDILELCMQVETNALDLYIKMLREIEDENSKKVFYALIEEEKSHLLTLANLLAKNI